MSTRRNLPSLYASQVLESPFFEKPHLALVMEEDTVSQWLINNSDEVVVAKKALSGGAAGVVAKTLIAPLSRVTILMQCQSMRPHKFHTFEPNNTRMTTSFTKIIAEEGGLRALWKGNGAAILHRFPYVGATFGGLEFFKATLKGRFTPRVEMMASSVGAAGLAVCASYPLDVIKTRLTTQTKTMYYRGVSDCCRKILQDEGFAGLYRGLGPTLFAAVPTITLNLFLYGQMKEELFRTRSSISPVETVCMGATSGLISSMSLFPVDLVRRQMQMEGLHGRPRVYANVWDAFQKIFACGYFCSTLEGRGRGIRILRGCTEFYRGLTPELVKVIPYVAVQFLLYETIVRTAWPMEQPLMARDSYLAKLK